MKRNLMNIVLFLFLAVSFNASAQQALGYDDVSLAQASLIQADASEVVQSLNINAATAEEIALLIKGIGPSKAAAIVEFRELHGPFNALEELAQVKGVGEKTLAKNKALIRFE